MHLKLKFMRDFEMLDGTVIRSRLLAPKLSSTYLFWVTLVMILTASIFSYLTGYYGGDLYGVSYRVDSYSLFFFTIVYLSGLFVSLYISNKLSKIKISEYYFCYRNKIILSLVFIFFSCLVVFLALWGGVGTIQRGVTTNRYADLFFALFDPYIFIILMIYFLYSNIGDGLFERFFLAFLSFIYLFLILRSGFTGFLILMLPIFILVLLRFFSKMMVVIMLGLSIFLFPIVRVWKWVIGSGLNLSDIDATVLFIATRGVIERFSAVPNMVYIENYLTNKEVLLDTSYLPFFQGYIGSFIHKLFFSSSVSLNTLYLHQTMQNTDTDSNSTFPLLSYFSLDLNIGFLTIIYCAILTIILACMLTPIFGKNLIGRQLMSFFLFYVIFFYVFNGWLWAVWGVIQAVFFFSILLMFAGKLSQASILRKEC
ncbi:oligosaccharide repeat unit polymerase [Aeromonas veronii]|uniref:oligosaccharide repeat unit polymerase n=4 Tax=Aeromonas veronii TaxID=654 RepID=UPI0011CF6E55|nr:oligosaccharide repeat unit polymerase [Aeromonas veronii]